MRKYINDDGGNSYAIVLNDKELALVSSLLTHHIKTLEGLIESKPPVLPSHKEWMYNLEDKLEK